MDSKFDDVQESLSSVRKDIAVLKESMVTKEVFQKLEDRVEKLESVLIENNPFQSSSSEMQILRREVSRLDPANKSIIIRGFKCDGKLDRSE